MTLLGRSPTAGTRTPAAAATQVFWLLRAGFTVLPVVFGLDKFANVLTNWPKYLAPQIDDLVPGTAAQAMLAVGVVEILAGLLVAGLPPVGAPLGAPRVAGLLGAPPLPGGHAAAGP